MVITNTLHTKMPGNFRASPKTSHVPQLIENIKITTENQSNTQNLNGKRIDNIKVKHTS